MIHCPRTTPTRVTQPHQCARRHRRMAFCTDPEANTRPAPSLNRRPVREQAHWRAGAAQAGVANPW